jgi:dTDP-glucose 4,6-dehydratase
MTKILVTGNDGFVGSNLIDCFIENEPDTEIIGLSKKTIASNDIKHNFKQYSADINDIINLNEILNAEKPSWIIHLAAEADVSRSYQYPYDFLKVNTEGTFNLLEWLKHNKETKLVHFSTDEVFGEVLNAKETDRLNPLNPYSASKASAEAFISAYNKAYNIHTIVFRPYNIFGAYQKPNRLFSKIITNAVADKPFNLFKETQEHKRGWIYVKNIYYAVRLLMDKGIAGESYNMEYDAHLSVADINDSILKIMGKESLFKGYMEIPPRAKDDIFYSLDSTKIRELGYKPRYTFEEGLKETIDYYKGIK